MDGINPSSCTKLFAEWAPRFDRDRFELIFCGLKGGEPAGEWLAGEGARVLYLGKGKFSPSAIGALVRLIESERIDLVHLHGYSSANFGRMAARRAGVPAVVHEHAILKVQPHQFAADWLLRGRTDVAIAVSGAVKRFVVEGRSVPPERVRIINNGVSLDRFVSVDPAVVAARRRDLGIPDGAPVAGTMTRLREEKGNRYFIEAAAHVCTRFPDARFLIAGDGPLRDELQAQARSLGVADRVIFAGFCEDVPVLLGLIDVKVIPSLTEGFPLALVEAMAAGKAIVSTDVGGIKEVAVDGENALLVPPADGRALGEKIAAVFSDPALRSRLATNARRESAKYGIDRNVAALQELYCELAPAGRR